MVVNLRRSLPCPHVAATAIQLHVPKTKMEPGIGYKASRLFALSKSATTDLAARMCPVETSKILWFMCLSQGGKGIILLKLRLVSEKADNVFLLGYVERCVSTC